MSSALQLAYHQVMKVAAGWYQRTLAKELNAMGVTYEDLMVTDHKATGEALELAHPDVHKGRYRRLKRASDLCFKGKRLQDYQDTSNLDPFKFELWDDIQKIKARDQEKALLDLHKK